VGPNCYIRGSTYIGRNCRVGNAVEVKNTVLMDRSNIPHHNYVGDSVIMEDVNLGAGTKVANLRLDGGNVTSVSKGKRINTGLRKLGTIIGPGVKTGINSVIDVGTVISEDAFIGPGARVKGFIAPGAKVY
jgi:bifunctional UDP-N-acetylglucosamine pyrophosphorylase/glucosamine-1-phosphate N-acetyltransferase